MTSSKQEEFAIGLLGLSAQWDVMRYKINRKTQTLDIWLGVPEERNKFWFSTKTFKSGAIYTWRHLDMLDMHCYLHVQTPSEKDLDKQNWQGDTKLPFTYGMANRIAEYFREGLSINLICSLLNVNVEDIWKLKFGLDNGTTSLGGKVGIEPQQTIPALNPVSTPVTAPVAAPVATANNVETSVPDAIDPIWEQIITGRIELDIQVLSLKLLLTRLKSQMRVIQDDGVKQMKLGELHRYFEKNAKLLGHEIKQMQQFSGQNS
ncbi:hypothetical protein ACMYR3_08090 [Ampullimonas aquatilis]|uniref:hypothetical protein n=1 Tax=Ampullimonas aquatilis TaxID=1341549 RepID=UPI003C70AAEC